MFGRKHPGRRPTNIFFVIFRLILSVVMFGLLLGGAYQAYKHFSGMDPLKLNPQTILKQITDIQKQAIPNLPALPALPVNNQPAVNSAVSLRFLLIADSHSDNANLQKAIQQAKSRYQDLAFIIGLGDYTEVGTVEELRLAKNEFDKAQLRYFLIPGDHDLWDDRDKGQDPTDNFKQIFGPTYQSFTQNNFKFLLLDNSDNYQGIKEDQQTWISKELEKAKSENVAGIFVFIHEPLFHPSSDRFMGKVEKSVKKQAESLLFELKQAGVKKVFSGDIHYFSLYEEPVTKIPLVTIGAATVERNPQTPRYALVTIFADGSTGIEDVEIK